MILKGEGGGDFRGIGLVVVLWKEISGIINLWILYSMQFHGVLHEFCAGRGTGTATLMARLIQQLIAMREIVLNSIFLGLRKAYYYLERERFLDMPAEYGMETKMISILRTY